jgi:tagatose 6-phosphate kinase
MITTVTLNTAVDKLYLVEDVQPNTVMRVQQVSNTAGGKGLNVSKVAALCGASVRAMGFLGGFTGGYVRSLLSAQGITPAFTEISGETRSCINIRNMATGKHTEYLEPGVPVTPEELDAFLQEFKKALPEASIITVSGSVPQGTPSNFYATLVQAARNMGKPLLLDTSGQLLRNAVTAKPTLIKPNTDEIEQLLGARPKTREEMLAAVEKLHKNGIDYVISSLGAQGAIMVCSEGSFWGITPNIPVVNTVGCGDAMMAGFAVSMAEGRPPEEMLRFATAVSTANALTIPTGYFEQDDLKRLLTQVKVKKLV